MGHGRTVRHSTTSALLQPRQPRHPCRSITAPYSSAVDVDGQNQSSIFWWPSYQSWWMWLFRLVEGSLWPRHDHSNLCDTALREGALECQGCKATRWLNRTTFYMQHNCYHPTGSGKWFWFLCLIIGWNLKMPECNLLTGAGIHNQVCKCLGACFIFSEVLPCCGLKLTIQMVLSNSQGIALSWLTGWFLWLFHGLALIALCDCKVGWNTPLKYCDCLTQVWFSSL